MTSIALGQSPGIASIADAASLPRIVARARKRRRRSALPGLGLSLGITMTWLGIIVLIPLAALFMHAAAGGWSHFVSAGFSDRAMAAYKVSFGTAFIAASVNVVFGLLLAYVLVRYRFPGRRLLSAAVDLPFALPTAVAGIALTGIYADTGWIGSFFAQYGIPLAYKPQGIVIALIFIGLPFIVRTVEPVLEDLGRETEEAAATLGASKWRTFAKVVFPEILPALTTGFALAFARGVGEYGSVIFIAGNQPFESEIAPLLIVTSLEQYDYAGATDIAVVMLLVSMAVLFLINFIQNRERERRGL